MTEISALSAAEIEAELDALAELLWDCVDGGAAVSFIKPFSRDEARAFWRGVAAAVAAGKRIVLAARLGPEIVGSVQLDFAAPPNQRHRAEVMKLLVLRRARRRGIARALMLALEAHARAAGRTLLTLDTRSGDAGEPLYRGVGYRFAGTIPRYSRSSEGTLDDTSFMYKELG